MDKIIHHHKEGENHMNKEKVIILLKELLDEVKMQPHYGVLSSFGISMGTWNAGKTLKELEHHFLYVEAEVKALNLDESQISPLLKHFMNHDVYYDVARQKLGKVKKDLKKIIAELEG